MNYAALLLLTFATLVRPSEYITAIFGTQLYLLSVGIATVASLPQLMRLLSRREIASSPITVCVFGMLAAVPLAPLRNRNFASAFANLDQFARPVLFYLIIVGALLTPRQLTFYLRWIVFCIAAATIVCLLDFHGAYDFPFFESRLMEGGPEGDGIGAGPDRLQFTGIFNNPNGLSRLLVLGIMISVYFLTAPGAFLTAPLWLGLIGMFGHALMLTRSRGGLLGLMAGVAILFLSRFGIKRALPLGAVALVAVVGAFAGSRQTHMDIEDGTGQHRIQLWDIGMEMLKDAPLFGIGYMRYNEYVEYVAHNSFVHGYVELGLFGGACFVGCYYFAIDRLIKLRAMRDRIADPVLRRIPPYLIAILGAEAAGMLSISLTYALSTFMVLGMVAGYIRIIERQSGIPNVIFDRRAAKRLAAVGALAIFCIYTFIKSRVRY